MQIDSRILKTGEDFTVTAKMFLVNTILRLGAFFKGSFLFLCI